MQLTENKIRKPYIVAGGYNPGNGKQLVPFQFYYNDINVHINGFDIVLPVTLGWRGTYYETFNGAFIKRVDPVAVSQCGEGASNGDKLLDRLRDEGYDVIIFMNDNGIDYMENNAALLMELIAIVNNEKMNGANPSFFENIVGGYSAGAVSTRLALSQMEAKFRQGLGPNPHTKMWMSIESENQASNVPLGLQHFLDFQSNSNNLLPDWGFNILQVVADFVNYETAQLAQSFSENPGAWELTRFTSLNPSGGPTTYRSDLLSTFAGVNSSNGYPEFCRRVGVSMGSGKAIKVPHASSLMFDTQLKFDPFGNTHSDYQDPCLGTYTVYEPYAIKTTTARWWSAINSTNSNIFDGKVEMNGTWTWCNRLCLGSINVPGVGWVCTCIGPYTTQLGGTGYVIIGDKHVAKPTAAIADNWDDAPASLLSSQVELYTTSVYPFYNNWFAGNAYCNKDLSLHSFAPAVSTLDLHNPSTGLAADYFTDSPVSLNLMFNTKDIFGTPTAEINKSFGYPHLKHPSNHYQITPYDAVYAIGDNVGFLGDGSTPRTPNQFHNEDPQIFMGDYIARVEVAPTDLFLSDRVIGSVLINPCSSPGCYTAEFEARNTILVGNGIYGLNNNVNFLTPDGDFSVSSNTKAIIHCGIEIQLLPGTNVDAGSELDAFILPFNPLICGDHLFRSANNNNNSGGNTNSLGITQSIQPAKNIVTAKRQTNTIKVYPNPNNGTLSIERETEEDAKIRISDLTGKTVYETNINGAGLNNIDLSMLQDGIYMLMVGAERFKIIITK
jgi:hypothetical protein